MVHRAYKYRLKSNREQDDAFRQISGSVRAVYNAALEQREHHYRQYQRATGNALNYNAQSAELKHLRKEFDWIKKVPYTAMQEALKDLQKAYQNFFAGRSGYPSKRRKGINNGFRFHGREVALRQLNRSWWEVRLPKVGWVRFKHTREIRGRVLSATITEDALGWHVSFACEIPDEEFTHAKRNGAVGIDRGVKKTIAYSDVECGDGGFDRMPAERLNGLLRKAKAHQRKLSAAKRGSKRYRKHRERLSRITAKAARIRKHNNHVWTHRVSQKYGIVVLENLKTRNMTGSAKGTVDEPGRNVRQKSGLNRAILNQAWFQYEDFLSYKLQAMSGELRKVPAPNTSRRCSECGFVSKESRKSQAVFECVNCGHEADADTNAAINILLAGTQPSEHQLRESRCNA